VRSGGVQTIIDISHENPVYDPAGLEEGGVEYHKFPIVSKLPPTADEVLAFNALVDRLRVSPKMVAAREAGGEPTIGVHCHYGFNRYAFLLHLSYFTQAFPLTHLTPEPASSSAATWSSA
jgi:hypothetical protein